MFKHFKSKKEEMDKIQKIEEEKPIDKEIVENMIKLIEVAHEIGCRFSLIISMSIGEFVVDSASYIGIKMVNNKKDGEKLLIQHQQNMLLSNDTYIELEHINHIDFSLEYSDKYEQQ